MMFLREAMATQGVMPCGVMPCGDLQAAKAGQRVKMGGLVVRPHRPPTAQGVCFFSLEDESGMAHVAVLPDVYQRTGTAIYSGGAVIVQGSTEKRGAGISVLAGTVTSLS